MIRPLAGADLSSVPIKHGEAQVNRPVLASSMVILALGAGALTLNGPTLTASGSTQDTTSTLTSTLQQQHSFGTIARGSTVCVGPLSPTAAPDGTTPGVQIFGFTNGEPSLTWQVFSVSSQSAPVLVFQTTARFVDATIPPSGNFLFQACVVKSAQSPQDYDLTLNSFPVE
jgi:hypothetical protein